MKILIGILFILAGLVLFISLFKMDLGYVYGPLGGCASGLLVAIGWLILKSKR